MNTSAKDFLTVVDLFQKEHKKVYLRKKKKAITLAYLQLKSACRQYGARCKIRQTRDSVTIRIICKGILLSEEASELWFLFHQADLLEFSCHQRHLRIDLWFRCWQWEPRQ